MPEIKTLAFSMLRAAARITLPTSMRQFLIDCYLAIQTARKGSLAKQFAARPAPLATFPPAFEPRDFASGPVVMVNNALAAGGVERQIVNTLRVLGQRTDRSFGLLCLRLGEEPHFDFFRPLLDSFPGFVRNATSAAQANRVLATMLPTSASKRLRLAIGWMPSDVQEEVLRFAAEFATLKPSVVHAWQDGTGIATVYAARMIGVPRTMISTRNVRPTNFGWYRPYMYHAHGEIARCPDIVMINNSQAGANDYANWLDIPVNRFVVKRNGLDTATIRRANPSAVADLRGRLGIPPGASIIGSIFRFYEEKRPMLWVEAAAEIAKHRPGCHFVVFGDGPLQQAARNAAREFGMGECFHTPGTIENTETGLSLLDVFVLTSAFEGTPNVVLEATCLGVPVVATEAGGTREAIEEGVTGHVVAAADPTEIAKRVLAVLGDAQWRSRVKTEGPRFVEERFGLGRMIKETLALYGPNEGRTACSR
jgi:glycosyltransferase involved in cell wall biosynthesis